MRVSERVRVRTNEIESRSKTETENQSEEALMGFWGVLNPGFGT